MPAGDRTGPLGLGPKTGRAAGYCAGFAGPGFSNAAIGRGDRNRSSIEKYSSAPYGPETLLYGVYGYRMGGCAPLWSRLLGWIGGGFGRPWGGGRCRGRGRGFGRGRW